MGHWLPRSSQPVVSALPPEAAAAVADRRVRFGPIADIATGRCWNTREAGDGARLMMPVLYDDALREYAYGPAQGLPDTSVGTFPPSLYDEAKENGWSVISMKNDWKRIFV